MAEQTGAASRRCSVARRALGELERIVAMTWYRRLPSTLVELANSRGGDDNITVVVGLVANAPP